MDSVASVWITRWAHLIAAGGAVLDVAAGSGRHARWLAARGHRVLAVDRDAQALESMASEIGIDTLNADLEDGSTWPLSGRTFDAVVVTNYLHRPLFGALVGSLAPGGVLLYETFAAGNASVGKPSNPAFLLAPGELLDAVRGPLRVIGYEDGFLDEPRPAYVQRICAVREANQLTIGNTPPGPPRYALHG
ncbi:class I SAM-dependent methyltransferase [Caballeronia sp. LZ035]|uniref:class I SAM-dependent methyltransferase n=1 Tax=Caballeronia sp. LZ035 TaxID=3038568 RepID=UPI002857D580|nr:class I SAM-dependent methyltransferase [Caballeronia sp. LZ035]MDR5757500.1 class I SAM-dependent methyltransferase [Caballeronia sp. LZ035]